MIQPSNKSLQATRDGALSSAIAVDVAGGVPQLLALGAKAF